MENDKATCGVCGKEMELVRPGKHQCNHCETLWGPLWRHMHEAHGLILVDDECNQIALASDEARMAAGTPVAMILINALRSLDQAELVTLGKAIADRCEHTFEPRDHIRDATKKVCETNAELRDRPESATPPHNQPS